MAANVVHHLSDGFEGVAQTFTSSSFTPQADSVLFVTSAGFTNNSNNPTIAWTITDTAGLTWTPVSGLSGSEVYGGGFYNLDWQGWYAVVGASPVSMTITVDKFPGTQTSSYSLSVDSITGLESPYLSNGASDNGIGGSGTVTRTAPTGPTIVHWHAGTDDVEATWGTPDTGYTQTGESTGVSVQNEAWYSTTSTAPSVGQTWTSSGTEYSTTGFSVELVESAGGPVEGTATLTYGGTTTATGTAVSLGTGTAAYGGTTTATGQRTSLGTGTAAYGYQVDATGTIPVDTITGTAALTYGGTTAATGQRTSLGTGTAAYGYQVDADGEPRTVGTAALGYGGQVDATGQRTSLGTGTAAYGYQVDATGTIPTDSVTGTAVLAYGGTTVATGQRTSLGTGTAAYGYQVDASGVIPTGAVLGTAVLAYGGTTVATGQNTRLGTATAAYGGTTTATGQRTSLGTGTAAYGYQVDATGTIPTDSVTGTAVLAYGGALAAIGQRTSLGTVTAAYGGTLAGIGLATRHGTITAAYGGTLAATGTIPAPVYVGVSYPNPSGTITYVTNSDDYPAAVAALQPGDILDVTGDHRNDSNVITIPERSWIRTSGVALLPRHRISGASMDALWITDITIQRDTLIDANGYRGFEANGQLTRYRFSNLTFTGRGLTDCFLLRNNYHHSRGVMNGIEASGLENRYGELHTDYLRTWGLDISDLRRTADVNSGDVDGLRIWGEGHYHSGFWIHDIDAEASLTGGNAGARPHVDALQTFGGRAHPEGGQWDLTNCLLEDGVIYLPAGDAAATLQSVNSTDGANMIDGITFRRVLMNAADSSILNVDGVDNFDLDDCTVWLNEDFATTQYGIVFGTSFGDSQNPNAKIRNTTLYAQEASQELYFSAAAIADATGNTKTIGDPPDLTAWTSPMLQVPTEAEIMAWLYPSTLAIAHRARIGQPRHTARTGPPRHTARIGR